MPFLEKLSGLIQGRQLTKTMTTKQSKNMSGFTFIELLMVIIIVGIMASMSMDLIILPINGYLDIERRADLLDNAEMSLRRMQKDLRRALPNSIRLTGNHTVEWLHTVDGGRYRARLAVDGSGDVLSFVSADDQFDIIGSLSSVPTGELVIYNLGTTLADAYAGNNRATLDASSTVNKLVLSSAKLFPFSSPDQRFFIVDTPISYQCINNELRRYDNQIDAGYGIGSSISGKSYALQARSDQLSCNFSYNPGTATRGGLVTLVLNLTDQSGESVNLLHQVHVDNLP